MLVHLSPAPAPAPAPAPTAALGPTLDSDLSSRPVFPASFPGASSSPLGETVCFGDADTPEGLRSRLLQAALTSYYGYSRITEEAADADLCLFAQGVMGVRYGHCQMLARDIFPGGTQTAPLLGDTQELRDAWSRAVQHLRRGGSLSSPLFCRDIAFAENIYEELMTRVHGESHGRSRALLMRLLRSIQEARACWRELWDVELAIRS